jgi:hypothetical protein
MEGVDNPWVSLLELTFHFFYQFLFFQCICVLMKVLVYVRSALRGERGVSLPEDVARRVANHDHNEW